MSYMHVFSTVDVVLLTLIDGKVHVALVKRDKEPFAGSYALPGGFVHAETDPDSRGAARRVLSAKAGITAPYLEQLYTFSGPDRDPRGWSFSVTYYALVSPDFIKARANAAIELFDVGALPELAFDHNKIVEHAMRRLSDKSAYSVLPCYLLPPEFTATELQSVYELLGRKPSTKSVFRRILEELDFLEPIQGKFQFGAHRPAQMYRLKEDMRRATFDRLV